MSYRCDYLNRTAMIKDGDVLNIQKNALRMVSNKLINGEPLATLWVDEWPACA
ncbi:MAG: hypothetical protein Q9M14_00045 [Mariprofundaceae bacterium]|nr:hypothetical protein [Mariprofundaceae bacterium]